ncbi:hypothetical protein [Mariniflexile fucanivorans]|nr:hypothetical protein [Mariniflexile fucanivorans]
MNLHTKYKTKPKQIKRINLVNEKPLIKEKPPVMIPITKAKKALTVNPYK